MSPMSAEAQTMDSAGARQRRAGTVEGWACCWLGALAANLIVWAVDKPALFACQQYVFSDDGVRVVSRSYAVLLLAAAIPMGGVAWALARKRLYRGRWLRCSIGQALYWLWGYWVLNVAADWLDPGVIFEKQLLVLAVLLGFLLAWKTLDGATRFSIACTIVYLAMLPLVLSRHLPEWYRASSLTAYVLWAIGAVGWALTTFFRIDGERPSSVLLAAVASIALVLGVGSMRQGVKGPNLILIVVDTLRADALGCYGERAPTSPTLDRIAAEGVRFTNAYSPAPWTVPAHASLLTGVAPVVHGAQYQSNGEETTVGHLSPQLVTLAQLLAEAGYDTCGITSNGLLNRSLGFTQGFRHYSVASQLRGNPSRYIRTLEPWGIPLRLYYGRKAQFMACPNALRDAHRDELTVSAAEDWLHHRRRRDAPVFLFLNFLAPHYPYEAPLPYREQFLPPDVESPPLDLERLFRFTLDRENPPEIDWAIARQLYNGEVRYTDDLTGRVWTVLQREGLLDDAQVIITSDHGECFGDPPHFANQHNYLLDSPILRVPLIVWDSADMPAGATSAVLVSLEDVFAEILTRAGLPLPRQAAEAIPLLPVGRPGREVLVSMFGSPHVSLLQKNLGEHYPRLRDTDRMRRFLSPKFSVHTADWKLIHTAVTDTVELFDLRSNTRSPVSVSAEHPEEIGRLMNFLSEWREAHPPLTQQMTQLSDETRDALEALGYF